MKLLSKFYLYKCVISRDIVSNFIVYIRLKVFFVKEQNLRIQMRFQNDFDPIVYNIA